LISRQSAENSGGDDCFAETSAKCSPLWHIRRCGIYATAHTGPGRQDAQIRLPLRRDFGRRCHHVVQYSRRSQVYLSTSILIHASTNSPATRSGLAADCPRPAAI